MKIVIIDYGSGNIQSIQFALQRLGQEGILSNSIEEIRGADKVIFPGVGEAQTAMQKLKQSGLDAIIPTLKQPVLGICLGMQLMCDFSEERDTKGLGIFNTNVVRFPKELRTPHIGWNTITDLQSALFNGINEGDFMYFIHSYYVPKCYDAIATTAYDFAYSSALQKDNFYGVQFHPEKSGTLGAQVLSNFLKL